MFLWPDVAMVSSTMQLIYDSVDCLQEVCCNNRFDLPFWYWNGNIPVELGKHLGWWSPDFLRLQVISSHGINPLRPSVLVNLPSLIEIMACHLEGTKPLSEPMLEYY